MDTTYVNILQDSIKIKIPDEVITDISTLVDHYVNKPDQIDYSIYIPLLSALLGGGVAILVHWIAKIIERKGELKKEKMKIIASTSGLQTQLSFELENLAYFKQNTQLQYLYNKLEPDKKKQEMFYNEHYKSNANMLECEKSITQIISAIASNITTFDLNQNNYVGYMEELKTLQDFKFERAKDYSGYSSIPSDEEILNDIKELNTKYKQQIILPIRNLLELKFSK